MTKHYCSLIISFLIATTLPVSALAAEDESNTRWSFQLEAGLENQSNLTIEDIDTVSSESSSGHFIKTKVGVNQRYSNGTRLTGSIMHNRSYYEDKQGFDSANSIFSLGASHKFEDYTLGLRGLYVDSTLEGKDFLSLNQLSPYLSTFVNKKTHITTGIDWTSKDITTNPHRNSDSVSWYLDSRLFLKGLNHYVSGSIKLKNENAADEMYDLQAKSIKISHIKKFEMWDKPAQFRLSWRYQQINYDNEALSGIAREDDRVQWRGTVKLDLSQHLFLELEAKHNIHHSNVLSLDYDQNVYKVTLGYNY